LLVSDILSDFIYQHDFKVAPAVLVEYP